MHEECLEKFHNLLKEAAEKRCGIKQNENNLNAKENFAKLAEAGFALEK